MASSREDGVSAGDPKGRTAVSPWSIPLAGWREVLLRSWREASDDNVGLVAAGVAFYGFLALVPLLGAIVLSYGLVAEPETVIRNVKALTTVMPADAAKLVGEQLMNVVQSSGSKKGFGLLFALAVALFGARNGAGSIMTALNIAYEEEEKRSFLMVNLTALAITAGSVLVAILAVVAIAALGHLEDLFPHAAGFPLIVGKVLSYVLLFFGAAAGTATLYRYAPSRDEPRWVWLTPGSAFTAALWLVLTLGFGIYVANFGHYDATYGSLGAVIVLLTWLYLSSYILLFGAELNSELEHQTAEDTTKGPAVPLGQRGAWAADHVAGSSQSEDDKREAVPKALPAPSPSPEPSSAWPGETRLLVSSRLVSRAVRVVGLSKVGLIASGAATMGLSLLRRRGKAAPGAALLGGAALIAWLSREPDPPETLDASDGSSQLRVD